MAEDQLIQENSNQETVSQENNVENTEQNVENTETNETVTNENNGDNNQVKPEKRETRSDKQAKAFRDLQSRYDRELIQHKQEQSKIQQELAVFAPYKEALLKALNEKKAKEQEELYAQNPMEAQRRMAEEIAQQKMAPIQQRFQEMQVREETDQAVNYLQSTYGKQAYDAMESPMAQVLESVAVNAGPEAARLLARNPDTLFQIAVGQAYMADLNARRQQQAVGNKNQQAAVKFAQGTARPGQATNRQATAYDQMDDKQLEKAYYEWLGKQPR